MRLGPEIEVWIYGVPVYDGQTDVGRVAGKDGSSSLIVIEVGDELW